MRTIYHCFFRSWVVYMGSALLLLSILPCKAAPGEPSTASLAGLQRSASLLFTENLGQVADDSGTPRPDVLFTAHSGGAQLFITATAINYQFTKITYPPWVQPK